MASHWAACSGQNIEQEEFRYEAHKSHSVIGLIICLIYVCLILWLQQVKDREVTPTPTFDSACSVSSFRIQVTEEAMQHSAEALSRTGVPQSSDTQETVRKMAAMKTESVLFPLRLLLPMLFVLFNTVYVYRNRHRVRLNILKLLLERGADPNTSRVPMPVLFLAIMASDTEAVRRLLLCGARTDIPLPPKVGTYHIRDA